MVALMCFVLAVLALPFKSKIRLEAENAALRYHLIVLRRKVRGRAQLSNNDFWFFVHLYRWFPSIQQVVTTSVPRRWCAGIGTAFVAIGAGNRAHEEGGMPQACNDHRASRDQEKTDNDETIALRVPVIGGTAASPAYRCHWG